MAWPSWGLGYHHAPPATSYEYVPMINQQNRKAISRVETCRNHPFWASTFWTIPTFWHLFFLLRPRGDHWGRHHINVAQHLDFSWQLLTHLIFFFETSKHVTKANVENSFGSGNLWDLSFFTSFHHHFHHHFMDFFMGSFIISRPGSDHRARRRSSRTKGSSFRARSPSCRCRGFILDLGVIDLPWDLPYLHSGKLT